MSEKIAASRYAKALFKLDNGDQEEFQKNINYFSGILELFQLKESSDVLNSPVMPNDLKLSLLRYGLEKTGESKKILGFLSIVVEAGRVKNIPEMVKCYKNLINEASGIVDATITSSVELPDEAVANIISEIEKKTGKKIKANLNIDPSILGGFVVKMGNTLLDLSLKTKLDAITKSATL